VPAGLHEAAVSLVMLTNAAIYGLLLSGPDLQANLTLLYHHGKNLIWLYRQFQSSDLPHGKLSIGIFIYSSIFLDITKC